MQTQNIQLSEILDTIEEMGDLSESAMEAARARQELLPTGDKSDKMGEILRSRGSILYRQKQYAEASDRHHVRG